MEKTSPFTRFRIALAAAGLCAAFVPAARGEIYTPPTDGELARITVVVSPGYGNDFVIYREAESCKGRRYVQSPKDLVRTTSIRAGVPTAFAVGSPYAVGCYIGFRFTPEAGASYRAVYEKTNETPRKTTCTLDLERLRDGAEPQAVPDLEKLAVSPPFFASGSWCTSYKKQ